jgi:hypothetical protein
MTVRKDAPSKPCECGCGDLTAPGRRFIVGHNTRGKMARRASVADDGTATLYCPKCDTDKPLGDFPLKGKHRDGNKRYGYCKPCHGVYQREQKMTRIFNISVAEYDALLAAQDGLCAICCRPPKKNRLAVDHDHKSGLIRGLVCWTCNQGLGLWAESQERMQAACIYLSEPPAIAVLGERYGRRGRTTNKAPRRKAKHIPQSPDANAA